MAIAVTMLTGTGKVPLFSLLYVYIMKLELNSLLKDRNVLYVVLFIAVLNFFGYVMLGNLNAVLFFLALGLLTSYFSKNMIIVMLVAMIGTNFLMTKSHAKEGFEDKKNNNKSKVDTEPLVKLAPRELDDASVEDRNIPAKVRPATADEDEEEATGRKPKLDFAKTVEIAYDNLDKLLGSRALADMGDNTERLARQQKELMKTLKGVEPMMQRAGKMLEGLDVEQMSGMIENSHQQNAEYEPNTVKN